MGLKDRVKLTIILVLCLPLAVFCGFFSLSNFKAEESPDHALEYYANNGSALSTLSLVRFFEVVRKSTEAGQSGDQASGPTSTSPIASLAKAAAATVDLAREAYLLEPLSPKAHAVLALAENDPIVRKKIVEQATDLNSRQLALQGLLLEKYIAEGSYRGSIETIDQMLRTHPEVSDKFFPILAGLLRVKATLPQFVGLLGKPTPWRQLFLNFAANDPQALVNLAALRTDIVLDDEAFDKKLIGRLAGQGHFREATAVYRTIRPGSQSEVKDGKLSWLSDYPPLEWRLATERGLRASVVEGGSAEGGSALRIKIEPGEGGIVAFRVIDPPSQNFKLRIAHTIKLIGQRNLFNLQLTCFGHAAPFFDRPIVAGKLEFSVEGIPSDCAAVAIQISARAWTGSPAIEGAITSISVS